MSILSNNSRDWKLVNTISKNFKSDSRVISTSEKFDSNFLIVRVSTKTKKETWNFGGRLWIGYEILNQITKIHQADLDLFEQELIVVSKLFDGKYSLIYQAPNYFPDVTLKVWEYIGIVNYSISDGTPFNGNNNTDTGNNGSNSSNNNSSTNNLITFANLLF